MRILAVTPYYEPEGGGLERYAHAVLRRLARRGHEVRVLTFVQDRSLQQGSEPPRQRRDGVLVERLVPSVRLGNTPVDPRFPGRVAKAMEEFQPHVVVAHTPVPFPAEMAFLVARRRSTPFVVTYHAGQLAGSSSVLEMAARFDRATLERAMLAGSSHLIGVTSFVERNVLAGKGPPVSVVPPGVDPEQFNPGRAPQPSEREREVLFVGPLDASYRWKGIDVLWDAMHTVCHAVPGVRLRLVGEGDRRKAFQEAASTAPFEVEVSGRLPDDELTSAYRRAAVTALPSTSDAESFGMVLAEASACGSAVVGSDIGGIPSFIEHERTGLLARPGDVGSLATQITRLLTNRMLADALAERARKKTLGEHDWDVIAATTEEVLREVAREASPHEAQDLLTTGARAGRLSGR